MNHLEIAKNEIEKRHNSMMSRPLEEIAAHALISIAESLENANYLKAMELYTGDVIGFKVFDKFDLEYEGDK